MTRGKHTIEKSRGRYAIPAAIASVALLGAVISDRGSNLTTLDVDFDCTGNAPGEHIARISDEVKRGEIVIDFNDGLHTYSSIEVNPDEWPHPTEGSIVSQYRRIGHTSIADLYLFVPLDSLQAGASVSLVVTCHENSYGTAVNI